MQGKWLIIFCRDPLPPISIKRDRHFPCHVIWSCRGNLKTRTSPQSHPFPSPTSSSPESAHTLRSLLMAQQKLLLTRVLNTPEDHQSVGTDRTSKQPLRGSLDKACRMYHRESQPKAISYRLDPDLFLSPVRLGRWHWLWWPWCRRLLTLNIVLVLCDLFQQSLKNDLFRCCTPKGWFMQ